MKLATLFCLSLVCFASAALAEEDAAAATHLLRYQFAKGEQVRWKVIHLGTTETKIQGNTQTSKSRSVSTKAWQVTDVDADGNCTFSHTVTNVNMWQQLSDRPEVRYNSETDTEIPVEYQQVAQTVGVPLATITISPKGDIVEREGSKANEQFGIGGIVMLLPDKPVKAGSRWYEPSELHTRLPDGRVKKIKIRKNYTLEKVQTGVATISVKTEVLTPVNDARIEAQLVQQLTDGTIKFDVDAGRVISKEMNWDETVVGFNGADSMMKYLARFTEELLPAERRESKPQPEATASPAAETARASRDAKPALRRE
ncbi:MAG: DUF6263 family protein [Planctomycetota bacterium]|nr:DUF6263 family protein [Planctomycetota bacterium]